MGHETWTETGRGGQSACWADPVDETEHLLARDAMQCGVVSVDRRAPVQEAVMLLIQRDISGLPVTCEGRLDGMLSEKDLLRLLHETRYLPGVVEDYMTDDVTSFDVEDKLSVIWKHLVEHAYRRVPILYQGRLAGMITRGDLIRVYRERFHSGASATESDGEEDELRAEDVMKHGLLVVYPESPLYEAMDQIGRHHVTGLPVVDEGMNLLGIITEKDVLECLHNPAAVGATVEAFMTRNVVAFDRKAPMDRICTCLIENGFHRVPIVDGTRLVGIISRSDILKNLASVFKR